MVKIEEVFMIREMKSRGMYIKDIAKLTGRDPKTIRKCLKSDTLPHYNREKKVPSKLDNYKDYILNRMNEGCVNARIIYEEIKTQGYTGKMTILHDFMRPHRKNVLSKACIRFETHPGKQAQVDWGELNIAVEGKLKRIHCFVMVMGYSRKLYVEFTEDEKIDTLIGCHERAFQYFNGIPETILYDNMKTVVKNSSAEGSSKWNDKFLQFAAHQGFNLVRCRPYAPRTKGKVENGVKYVKMNFWPRIREFTGLHELNDKAFQWMEHTANTRLHGTTKQIPNERFKEEHLKSYNPAPFELNYKQQRKVASDCFISYETNRYSVPHIYIGSYVGVKDLRNGCIELYSSDGVCIATYEKSLGKYQSKYKKIHFEGILSGSNKKVAATAPKLLPESTPKVYQRSLDIYDELLNEGMVN